MVCGDVGGTVYILQIVGLKYGPNIVTAVDVGDGPALRCPACQHHFRIEKDSLGSETICPQKGCHTRLKVNPFIIK
jgi:hypothetical protein